MGLSPDDIVTYPLKQAVRGYSVAQVDGLLDEVADTVERLEAEAADLRERLRRCEDRLSESSETEATLKRTLVTAQRAAEQSLDEAHARATELVEEAQREASEMVEEARTESERMRSEAVEAARAEEAESRRRRQSLEGTIESLRIFERDYRSRLQTHLEEQLRLLREAPMGPPEGTDALTREAPTGPAPEAIPLSDPAEGGESHLTIRVHDESTGTHGDRSDEAGEAGDVGSASSPDDGEA